jgi:hypothetical protein
MNFFQQLTEIGAGIDISIRIKEKDGVLSVMVMPEATNKTRLDGKILTGSANEIDETFFASITPVLNNARGVIAQDLKASEEKKESKPPAEKKDTTPANKKVAQGKKGKKVDKKKTAPAIQERSMFDQPAEPVADETPEPADETSAGDDDSDDQTDSETE